MEVMVILAVGIVLIIVIPTYVVIKDNKTYKKSLDENNALVIENSAIHISGLPATGREECSITVKEDVIVIKNNRQEFNVAMDKIVGAVVSQETKNIQTVKTTTQKTPSVGKAVVGGVLFGPAGAVVGGVSGKTKSTSNVNTKTQVDKLFLNIDYISEGEAKQLVFEGSPLCRFYHIQNAINSRISGSGVTNL